mmetsp:Transcript_14441/g.28889  ORF Transcript_14441/g.28889 Transcript_14441/m.28889 type:complete len:543 (-) Transcript_14441:179-1807(-)|eukprot:CAMPEP_0194339210 /NCGR_PEP_ID=MMETSP0171-20130528/82226_1 /TAXON_ID=218684 /ORGANISM="Corethron pennatum, Strain L29A3" /LENGTH=542 /DNA_ID=CAMNT_0039103665 /DNA_START=461 /DNA_END=2089 /DNA_ORIENTATION=+
MDDCPAGRVPNTESFRTADRQRKALVVFGSLYTFLYVGALFGNGPMQILLEENTHFSSLCSPEQAATREICPAQTSALINVQFIAQMTSVFSPLLGTVADRYGAPAIGYLMTAFILSGLFLLVIAAEYLVDELLYVAFILLGFGTCTGSISIILMGRMYFTGQAQARVIFGLNALFDSAAITYLGLWGIAELTSASLTIIAACYLGFAVALFGGSVYLWNIAIPVDESTDVTPSDGLGESSAEQLSLDGQEPDKSVPIPNKAVNDNQLYTIVAERTPREQLTSKTSLLLALFFGIHVTANNWTLTTTRDFLEFLGDDEQNNRYLTIFTLATPASLVAVPFVDAIIYRFGHHGGLQCINVLALAYMIIRVSSHNLNVQVLGFFIFSFYRCFLFGVVFSFLPTLVAGHVIGKASGWMYLIAGVTALINIPLATIAVEKLDGDFFFPNLVYIVLYLPCIAFAWCLGQTVKRETRAKEHRTTNSAKLETRSNEREIMSRVNETKEQNCALLFGACVCLLIVVVAIVLPIVYSKSTDSSLNSNPNLS